MRPVARIAEVEANAHRLSSYLAGRRSEHVAFARSLIERGICFVIVKLQTGDVFAPSRFVGYADNSREAHKQNRRKHGRDTNKALIDLTNSRPINSKRLEREYRAYCDKVGVRPRPAGQFGVVRQYWDLR